MNSVQHKNKRIPEPCRGVAGLGNGVGERLLRNALFQRKGRNGRSWEDESFGPSVPPLHREKRRCDILDWARPA